MLDRQLKLALACLMLLTLVTVATASYYIWSNIVTITPSAYILTMNTPTQINNTTIKLSGNLTDNGVAVESKTISLYNCSFDGTTKSFITNVTTGSDGIFSYDWHGFTPNIQYWFIARYEVP